MVGSSDLATPDQFSVPVVKYCSRDGGRKRRISGINSFSLKSNPCIQDPCTPATMARARNCHRLCRFIAALIYRKGLQF